MEDIDKTSNIIQEGAFKWPHEAILLLIEEYRSRQNDFISGKVSQKKIWLLIAKEMLKHGYIVTGVQCVSKFSGLKRTYKTVKDYNKQFSSDIKTWPYLSLMDDLLGTKPFMSSVTTVSSTGKRSRMNSVCSKSSSDKDENSPITKKIWQTSPVEKLMEDLRNMRKVAEEKLKKEDIKKI